MAWILDLHGKALVHENNSSSLIFRFPLLRTVPDQSKKKGGGGREWRMIEDMIGAVAYGVTGFNMPLQLTRPTLACVKQWFAYLTQ